MRFVSNKKKITKKGKSVDERGGGKKKREAVVIQAEVGILAGKTSRRTGGFISILRGVVCKEIALYPGTISF